MTKEEKGKLAFDRFIAGAKSDTARDYWYSKFKQELGQEVGQGVQVDVPKETLEFGEWLLASEIEYVDNTSEGTIYMIFGYLDYSGCGLTIKDLHEIYLKQKN
jgi:hypothetical protein